MEVYTGDSDSPTKNQKHYRNSGVAIGATPPAPPVPDRIPSKESILSPEWTHAITTLMGHPLSSESGKCIQKWILYHAIQDPTDFWLTWDPTDHDDIKLLQKYVEKNGSAVYLPSSTVKNLISLWNYMYPLIKRERPVDQKCNVLYFLLDDHTTLLFSSRCLYQCR